jgi:hypothetical protein
MAVTRSRPSPTAACGRKKRKMRTNEQKEQKKKKKNEKYKEMITK